MFRVLPIRLTRNYTAKIQGHEKITKIVDRSKTKKEMRTEKPIFHFRSHTGLDRYMGNLHKGHKIRCNINGGRPYYSGYDVGKFEHLQDHFQDNIVIHSLSSDTAYVESIYKCHDFYNAEEREHKRRQYSAKTKYKSALEKFCAIDVEVIETEHMDEAIARVSILDGNLNVLLDEFIIPPGGEVMDYKYAQTGITPFDLEEKGQKLSVVRENVIQTIGQRTIIGHELALTFAHLGYLPKTYANNPIIELAHDNRVNFEVMVRNNKRHSGVLGLNAIAFILVNKDVRDIKSDTIDDCKTMIEIFQYMYHKMYEHNQLERSRNKMKKLTSDVIGALGLPKGSDGKRIPRITG